MFVLRDKDGKVLLLHRSQNMVWLPDYWVFFGGKVAENETPEEAVKRYARVQLDIDLEDLKLFKRYEFPEFDGLHERTIFEASLKGSVEDLRKRLSDGEGSNLGVLDYEEAKKLKMTAHDAAVIKDLFGKS